MKAYSYIRFSTPEQLKGTSLERQETLAREFCERNSLELDKSLSFKDLGVSGFTGENVEKGLGHFLAAIEKGKVKSGEFLLVEDLDRISRLEPLSALEIFAKIIRSGVHIATLRDGMVYKKDSVNQLPNLLSTIFKFSLGNEESAKKSFRVQRAWQIKREQLREKPLTARCPGWLRLDKETGKFIRLADACKLVQRIFRMSLIGIGKNSIARQFNQENISAWGTGRRKGRGWHGSYIQKILRNRAVIGEFHPHRLDANKKRIPEGEPCQNYFPRAISDELFYRVQKQRRTNARFVGRVGLKVSNLFTGKIQCGYCGSPMHFRNKGKWQYLVCDNASRGRGCEYVSWSYGDFETSFLTLIQELDFTHLVHEGTKDRANNIEAELAVKEGEFAEFERQMARIVEAIEDTAKPIKTLTRRLSELEGKQEEVKQALKRLQGQLDSERDKARSLGDPDKLKILSRKRHDKAFRLILRNEIASKISLIQVYSGGFKWTANSYKEVCDLGTVSPFAFVMDTDDWKTMNPKVHQYIVGRKPDSLDDKRLLEMQPTNRKQRFFRVIFNNGALRNVKPDFANPKKLETGAIFEFEPKGWCVKPLRQMRSKKTAVREIIPDFMQPWVKAGLWEPL